MAFDLDACAPYALTFLRIFAAMMIMQHGLSKLIRFPVHLPGDKGERPTPSANRNGAIQIIGSALIVLGLFTRPSAFILSGMTAYGYWRFHAKVSFYPMRNKGGEMAFYAITFLYLVFAGAGPISLDAVLFNGTWLYP